MHACTVPAWHEQASHRRLVVPRPLYAQVGKQIACCAEEGSFARPTFDLHAESIQKELQHGASRQAETLYLDGRPVIAQTRANA